jgi:hypothetical protein
VPVDGPPEEQPAELSASTPTAFPQVSTGAVRFAVTTVPDGVVAPGAVFPSEAPPPGAGRAAGQEPEAAPRTLTVLPQTVTGAVTATFTRSVPGPALRSASRPRSGTDAPAMAMARAGRDADRDSWGADRRAARRSTTVTVLPEIRTGAVTVAEARVSERVCSTACAVPAPPTSTPPVTRASRRPLRVKVRMSVLSISLKRGW